MQPSGQVRRWRWAVLIAWLAAPFAQAALQLELQPQGLNAAQIVAAERVLKQVHTRLPAAWQARFQHPVQVRWSDTLPAHVHGRARNGTITLQRALLGAVQDDQPLPRPLEAALIHELTHVLDRSPQGGWSRDARLRDLAGWQRRPWKLGRTANAFRERSPDDYERTRPAEFLAVNAEHLLLDPDYACRRPAVAAWFAANLGPSDQAVGCDSRLPLMQAEEEVGAATLLELDPARIYAVDYLLAEGNDQLMSRWGHSMLRLVICAPGRPRGPDCRLDLDQSLVLSYRAFVNDVQLSSWSGLVGAYPSRLFVLPLNQVIDEYTKTELRSLASVPLKLSRAEVENVVRQAAEMHWSYDGNYWFLSNNCAVEGLKLLRSGSANPRLKDLDNIMPNGLLEVLKGRGLADTSVLEDRREALRLGYRFDSYRDRYQAMFDVLRKQLPVKQVEVEDWLAQDAEQRQPWFQRADLRTSAALLLLEQAALRRQLLLAQDEVKQRYLNSTALKDGTVDKANATLQQMLANSGFLSRPAELLGTDGYGLPQPDERKQLEQVSRERQAQLLRLSTDLDTEVRALLDPARGKEIKAVEANVKQIGEHLRALHKAAGGLQLP